ncbi:hypothetical protein Tcan_12578 [Toxocara canis]|uniref:Uncharacterized protein n=1 Tax=Toxocara canis TaxID=6265 RepID=A0A0B2W4C4_TOXCA|nr:hypothetical protein Tcan_12578 [Toxocara canis]
MSRQCLSTCTPYHNAVNSIMSNFEHLALDGDSSAAEKYLNESCEYVICTLHCDVPRITHMCGVDTANLVIDLTRKSFASMETMALDTGAVSRWPRVCADIKTYKLPTRSIEAVSHNNIVNSELANRKAQAQVSSSETTWTSLLTVVSLVIFVIRL